MEQSIIDGDGSARAAAGIDSNMMAGISAAFEQLAQNDQNMGNDLRATIERSEIMEQQLASVPEILNRFEEANTAARVALKDELGARLDKAGIEVGEKWSDVTGKLADIKADLARGDERTLSAAGQLKIALILGVAGVLAGFGGLIVALASR